MSDDAWPYDSTYRRHRESEALNIGPCAECRASEDRVGVLTGALEATVSALALWEGAVGEINVWPPACRKAIAQARAALGVVGRGRR